MHVTDLRPLGRVMKGKGPGFRFYRGKDGKAVPPLQAGCELAPESLSLVDEIKGADLPAWIADGDFVVYGCQLDHGKGDSVPEHVLVSWHGRQPNAWLVQDGSLWQADGARALMPDDFDWEKSVTWIGHFQAARMELKRHMLSTFPDVRWAIVWESDSGDLSYDGQSELANQVRASMARDIAQD